jgi:hypothetical protein
LIKCRNELLDYLREEKLITDVQLHMFRTEHYSEYALSMANILFALSRTDDVQLVDYEWTILPFERLKLTIVTNKRSKTFEYST